MKIKKSCIFNTLKLSTVVGILLLICPQVKAITESEAYSSGKVLGDYYCKVFQDGVRSFEEIQYKAVVLMRENNPQDYEILKEIGVIYKNLSADADDLNKSVDMGVYYTIITYCPELHKEVK